MKTTITAILTLLVTLTFGQTKEMYQKIGDSLLIKGQYEEVIKYFDKELKKHSKNEDILRWLGYAHIMKNNLDLGEKYYSEALFVNPKCALCYLNIGRVYSLRGDNKKALEYFDNAVNTDPKDAFLYSNRAKLKEMLGDKFGALFDHNKAIEIDPNNSDYYVQRGLYNSNQGYSSLALSDFNKSIELSPGNYYPFYQRANIYFEERRFDDAFKDMNKAIELDSKQFSLFLGRGAIYDAMNEYKKSYEDYTIAISLNQTDYTPYLNRASTNYKLENLDASCLDYFKVLELIEKGNLKEPEIIKEVNGSIQDFCDTSKPSYYYQRGVAYFNVKEYQKAVEVYSKGLNKFPENAMTLSFQGNAYLALFDYKNAIKCYYSALNHKENILTEIKSNPRYADASNENITIFYNGSIAFIHLSIGDCKIYLGLFDEALSEINKAIEIAPDIKDFNKETYYNMRGYILLAKGKYEEAMNDFNKSIQINKNFPLAYVNRAIAKIGLTIKVKLVSYSTSGKFNNQTMNVNWTLPNKTSLKKSEANILSALSDCNTAIGINKSIGFAYYIRGQIKQMLFYNDYCLDLLTAKELGMKVETELLKDCDK
jgi:tetratricopeptide (TPR) repeat protein